MLEDDGPSAGGPSSAKNTSSSNVNGHIDDGEDSGVEEVAAALRSGMTGPSPQTEREREREREREAGAETEVEADNGLNPFRNRRAAGSRSVRRRQSRAMSFMDEGDELFVPSDAEAAGRSAGQSEEELVLLDVGGDEVERGSGSEAGNGGLVALVRDADMTDVAGSAIARQRSEAMVEDDPDVVIVDANGMPLGAVIDAGGSGVSGVDSGSESAVGGKRKR
jgi:hypothetical protein